MDYRIMKMYVPQIFGQRIIIQHSMDSHYQLLVKHDSIMDMLILNIHFKQLIETSSI